MARRKANSTKGIDSTSTITNSNQTNPVDAVTSTNTTTNEDSAKGEGVQQTLDLNENNDAKPAPKKRGRKPGSKNKPKTNVTKKADDTETPAPARRRGRPRKVVATVETPVKPTTSKEVAPKAPKSKKTAIETNICYQVPGKEINENSIYDWIKFIWTSELGRKESDIKSISVYLKPAESAIYYVVNNDYAGKLDF